MRLSARGSSDPDGNRIACRWFHYRQPGGAEQPLELGPAAGESLSFTASAAPAELHIVLELKDSGKPALFAYRRAVVTVRARI